ncbi:MAG: UDP-N-acetylglucosamine--N-acetylmuramyl-(pentapeptide) pyrophosphoryl-undecaprenol N-acetylglucosamine transferase [Patescibacteria group bacterium]
MKILITGAHFTPAVAVVEELKKYPDVHVVYVGRKTTQEGDPSPSAESKVLPKLGVKYIPIVTGRLQREFTPYTLLSLLKIPVGFIQALIIVLSEKPKVVLSFGGYVAVPTVFTAWLFSIPIIVHEQTLVSGLANKISSFFADKIALSFRRDGFADKTLLTGDPIRSMIVNGVKLAHPRGVLRSHRKTILITGGNQGSHIINKTVEECLNKLTKIANIIHVTGDNKFKDFERLKGLGGKEGLEGKYSVEKWIGEEWGEVLSNADLVVSRAGINTLTELSFLGKPALVVPIPYLYKDEQNKNAKFFENLGLVKILPQKKLSADTLLKNIRLMLDDLPNLKDKAKKAKEVIIPDAAKRLALETVLLGN